MSRSLSLLASVAFLLGIASAEAADQIKIFAAASIAPSLEKAAAGYMASGKDVEVQITPAASGPLAKQIEAGAPADVFVSADLKWMKYLTDKALVKPDTVYNLAGNTLVVVAGADRKVAIDLADKSSFATALGDERLAVGEPKSVPAGAYAEEALKALGLYDGLAPHFAQAESVRAALQLVARGEASLGIVYATDAKAEKGVSVVATFPESSHKPIVYPIGLTATASPAAGDFVAWLKGDATAAILADAGFARPQN